MTRHKSDDGAREERGTVVPQSIVSEMKESYLDYAMSVITARALPDVRDGLKPVQRRVLYTCNLLGVTAAAKPRKSAAIIGDVMGKFHPHGDAAIYDAMVKMGQSFGYRYPLIVGQGNFGSIDGDPPAAMRYTEAKLSKLAGVLLKDLEADTVAWRDNYDGTRKEPIVLPAVLPNLLLNGSLGIAVGMATNVPPHNVSEIVDATAYLIDNPDATTDDLLGFVKGPDFPVGGTVFGKNDIRHAYANGKGGVVTRGTAEIVEDKKGQSSIIITSIPFRVNKADLITRIADLVHEKKLEGVRDLRDESTTDIRVVVELKANAHPQKVLNYLYKHTQLEETFHYNMVALVGGVPKTLSLKGILEEFIAHRLEVVRRRSEFELARAKEREHILEGLTRALDHIDKIIALIKKSRDVAEAHAGLMKTFDFSDRQATAILEMKLSKLAGLERKKIEDELAAVQIRIKELLELLGSDKKMRVLIKKELAEATREFSDERRTKVVAAGVLELSDEDLIPDEESVLVLTEGGYIKRTNPSEYRAQRRGGTGVVDLNTKDEDFVTSFVTASTHSDLLFFTDLGKVYQIKMYDVPEGKRATKGKSVMNFLSIGAEERITSILAAPKGAQGVADHLVMVTKSGVVKKVVAKSFADVRRSGLIALKLAPSDQLVAALLTARGSQVVIATMRGKSIRFKEEGIRAMGRTAGGVRGIALSKGDVVVSASVFPASAESAAFFVMSANGYGKKTKITEYKVQKRGGTGVKTMSVTAKTGPVMAARVVTEGDSEVVAVSKNGQVIRVSLAEIPTLSRATQGVRIMKMRDGDSIASLVCF